MPFAAPKPCSQCGKLVDDGSARCDLHKVLAGSFADRSRGNRHHRGYGKAWDRVRAQTLAEQGGICQPHLRRGRVVPGCRIVDHIVLKERGGTDDRSNLQSICSECHGIKSSVEALLARGLPVDVDAKILASLTPVGVAIEAAFARPAARRAAPASAHPGGGEKSGASSTGTDRLGGFSRAGVRGGGVLPEGEVTHG